MRARGHARRTAGIRMRLPATERLFWHCGTHTAKPESAWIKPIPRITKICCFRWHVTRSPRRARCPDALLGMQRVPGIVALYAGGGEGGRNSLGADPHGPHFVCLVCGTWHIPRGACHMARRQIAVGPTLRLMPRWHTAGWLGPGERGMGAARRRDPLRPAEHVAGCAPAALATAHQVRRPTRDGRWK